MKNVIYLNEKFKLLLEAIVFFVACCCCYGLKSKKTTDMLGFHPTY